MKTRSWILLGAAAVGAVTLSLVAEHGDGKRARPETAAAPTTEAPYRARAPGPTREQPTREAVAAARAGRDEAREHRTAPVVNGVVQIGPKLGGKNAAPPPATLRQAATSWATSYAVAMCSCHTRSCAADLQGGFVRSIGGIDYDSARDGEAYQTAIKRAVDCYLAMPEGT
jgi:hypothetical protein